MNNTPENNLLNEALVAAQAQGLDIASARLVCIRRFAFAIREWRMP